jgi:hypothetical protein
LFSSAPDEEKNASVMLIWVDEPLLYIFIPVGEHIMEWNKSSQVSRT